MHKNAAFKTLLLTSTDLAVCTVWKGVLPVQVPPEQTDFTDQTDFMEQGPT